MLKVVYLPVMLILPLAGIFGQQTGTELQKQLDELRVRIRTLENENRELSSAGRSSDSITYCQIRTEIFETFAGLGKLDADYRNITEKIEVTGLFSKLLEASNPTSDILGFRFTEIIFKSAEKHLLDALKNEKDKKRFSEVIGKIIDNPVVTTLANTNPVTSVVASIISAIAGFTTSKVDLEKEGGKIRNVTVEQQGAFDNRCINAFHQDLEVYIEFYDAMIITSDEFLKSIDYLRIKYFYLIQYIREYKASLYSAMDINENNMLVRLSSVLPDPASSGLDFHALTLNEHVQKCQSLSGRYSTLQFSVDEFRKEYNIILFRFLTGYRQILETALEFPERDIDNTKTSGLISNINEFISNQLEDIPEEPGRKSLE